MQQLRQNVQHQCVEHQCVEHQCVQHQHKTEAEDALGTTLCFFCLLIKPAVCVGVCLHSVYSWRLCMQQLRRCVQHLSVQHQHKVVAEHALCTTCYMSSLFTKPAV